MFQVKNTSAIPIEDFMYSKDDYPAIGSIFRLTESDLVAKLEKLVSYIPGVFDIRDTAGQHQLFLSEAMDAITFIIEHYNNPGKDIAA